MSDQLFVDLRAEVTLIDGCLNATLDETREGLIAKLEPLDFADPRHALMAEAIRAVHGTGRLPSLADFFEVLRAMRPQFANEVMDYATSEFIHLVTQPYFSPDEVHAIPGKLRLLRVSREASSRVDVAKAEAPMASGSGELVERWVGSLSAIPPDPALLESGASGDLSDTIAGMPLARESLFRCGIDGLDRVWGPRRGQVTVLAGATSVGKSVLAMQMAINAARGEMKVLFVSLEMSVEDLAFRAAHMVSEGASCSIGTVEEREHARAQAANLMPRGIVVKDRARTITAIRTAAAEAPFDVMVIDYLQKIVTSGQEYERREREVAAMSDAVVEIAKARSLHAIVVSQLSREHQKLGRPPELCDLRESGAIEQDADNVVLLYAPDEKEQKVRILRLAKNRAGAQVRCRLIFKPERMSFFEIKDSD